MSSLTPFLSLRVVAPILRFSPTERRPKMRRPSGTRAMPRRRISSGARPTIDLPSNTMVPPTGLSAPVIVISVVDLPAPLWPTIPTNSPSSTAIERLCTALMRP